MAISIDESIRILKAEIIAQDQRLPTRRIEPLQEAFVCLKQRFKSRKNILAILGMAEGVLQYLQKRQAHSDPDCLDFLKEAMAHVVNVYEEGKFDPEREEELGKRMYKRFIALREILKQRRRQGGHQPAPAAAPAEAEPVKAPVTAPAATKPAAAAEHPEAPARPLSPVEERRPATPRAREYKPALNSPCRTIMVGDLPLAIESAAVALVDELTPQRRGVYIASSQIPINDFARFFHSLAGRFTGPLAAIPSRLLKKLHLPLVVPKGGGLSLLPDEHAEHLLVLSHGQWHGVILGTLTATREPLIARWHAAANGDICGLATLDDDASYPLLNPRSLLEREGFIIETGA